MAKLSSAGLIGFLVWVGSFIDFFVLSAMVSRGFKAQDLFTLISILKSSNISILLLVFLIVGLFGLLIFILDSLTFIINRESQKKRKILVKIIFIIFAVFTLPIQIFFSIIFPPSKTRNYFFKIIFALLVLIFFLPTWVGFGAALGYFPGQKLGFIPASITVAGGSMYPTFPKPSSSDPKVSERQVVAKAQMYQYPGGFSILGKKLFEKKITAGDLVVFENNKTREITKKETGEESGFIKRAVAIGGDTIQIKDGLVYVNGNLVKEPYIARARSTFGGQFLQDCQELIVPEGKIFVMGDNRKGSDDSRFDVGFVDLSDVEYVLSLKDQSGDLVKGWHDPINDDKESTRITLDPNRYLSLVNNLRVKNGLKPVAYQPKLTISSQRRGEAILNFDDLSFQATKSGYTMRKAMAQAGYSNIVYGELPANGAYTASELFEYDVEFPNTRDFLLNKDYQEMGIATVNGSLNNCPATIVVLQMAGYVPPNYSKDQIKSWEDVLKNLKDVQGGWQDLKKSPQIYDNNKNDVDRINDIIQTRINNVSTIVAKMEANQWLTDEQNNYLKGDEALSQEQNKLATKLNSL